MEILASGGVLMVPLAILLVWGLAIIAYKMVSLRRSRVIDPTVVSEVERLLIERKVPEATAYCKQHESSMTRIMQEGIINYEKSEAELKEILEEAGRQEMPVIRSHIAALGTIASVSPLLGLLGTVLGMISVFTTLSAETEINSSMLAGGISEALVTTAAGMLVAVPTLVSYNYFINRISLLVVEMERISLRLVAVLKR